MANKKIKSSDIVEPKLLSGLISEAKELLNAINGIQDAIKGNIKVQKEFLASTKVNNFQAYKQTEESIKKVKTETELLTKAEIDRKNVEAQLAILQKQETIELAKSKIALQQRTKALQDQAREELGLIGAYDKTNKRLNDLRKSYQNLVVLGRENGKVARGMKGEIERLDKTLKKADASTGKFNRNVGNYTGSLKEAIGSSSIFGGKLSGLSSLFESLGSKGAMLTGVLGAGVAGALGALNLVLSKTETGMDFVERETSRFTSSLRLLADRLLDLNFTNLLNDLRDAGQAGADYADEMDRINDKVIANTVSQAKLNAQIAKNKLAMEDENLTISEKLKLAKEAIRLDVQRTGVDLVNGKSVAVGLRDESTLIGQARARFSAINFKIQSLKAKGLKPNEEERKELAEAEAAQIDVLTEAFIGRKKLAAQIETFERDLIKKRQEKIDKEKEQLKERSDLFEKELKEAEEKANDLIENPTFTNFKPGEDADKILNDSIEAQRLEAEAYLDKLEKEKEAEEKQAKFLQDLQKTVTDSAIRELEKQYDARIEVYGKEIDKRQENISKQEALAERGSENQLAFEKKKLAEAEVAQERAQKQKIKNQKLLSYFSLISAYASNGDKSAIANAFADILTAETISAFFWEGAENVADALGDKGRAHGGRDGYRGKVGNKIIAFDGEERVLSAKQNRLIGDISNDELATMAYNTRIGAEKQDGVKDQTNYALLSELKKLNENISKKKDVNVSWNSLDERIVTTVQDGMKKTVKHILKRPRI